jgi:DNA-binding NtrC family response regulator
MTEYSIINKLKDQNKLNDQILVCLNNLTLEDLIAVKLELSTNLLNHRLYGLDIWNKMSNITKEAILKFSLSVTKNKTDAARFLGITQQNFRRALKNYNIEKDLNV